MRYSPSPFTVRDNKIVILGFQLTLLEPRPLDASWWLVKIALMTGKVGGLYGNGLAVCGGGDWTSSQLAPLLLTRDKPVTMKIQRSGMTQRFVYYLLGKAWLTIAKCGC